MTNRNTSVQDLCSISLCTAIIAILAQIAIPMPFGVPMTMQTFAITLVAIILGPKKGCIASLIYVLLGTIGIPVFSEFTGGIQILLGPTGGFIFSFPIMAYLIGLGADLMRKSKALFVVCLIQGTLLNYIAGVIFFCFITESSVSTGIAACVIPFIPTAIIKAIAASAIGVQMRRRLSSILQSSF